MKRASTIAALLLAALLAPAAPAAPLKGEWVRVRTRNFTIVSDAGEGRARKLGAELEQFRRAVELRRHGPPAGRFLQPFYTGPAGLQG